MSNHTGWKMGIDIGIDRQGPAGRERVLIVDDDLVNRAMLEDILGSNGYDVKCVVGGEEGLGIVRSWNPSVVILDIVMPGMDGISVCKAIRGMNQPSRPSVIMMSAVSDKATIVESLSSGADDYVVKPVNEAELAARVNAQTRISGFYREIADDKKTLETILDISSALSATLDPAEVLSVIVTKVAGIVDAERCSIVLVAKEDEGYVLASHEDPSLRELKIDLSRYPEIKEVCSTKTTLVIEDIEHHPLMECVKDKVRAIRGLSLLVVPIVFNDDVLGTLFLRTRRREAGFRQKDIDFCRIVANASFHAIKNAALFARVSMEKESLREMSIRDQLTSLFNHNFFYTRLDEEFERAVRYETPLSLIMMDIDNFKHINDRYGHRVGDIVLKELAVMIKRGVRKTDIVARYGGEEFAVVLPHTLQKGAAEEAERIREIIESHAYAGLVSEKITVSVGVASYPQKGAMNAGDLVNYADDALYRAKWGGKNCVKIAE